MVFRGRTIELIGPTWFRSLRLERDATVITKGHALTIETVLLIGPGAVLKIGVSTNLDHYMESAT